MKSLIFLLLLGVTFANGFSQSVDLRRKIAVTGTAESEITPDIIFISISLKEYYSGNKKVTDINELEKQLQDAVVKAGIPKENLTINNLAAYNYAWEKKKNPNFAASKQYRLKLSDPSKFNQVIAAIDAKSIEGTYVEGYDHTKLVEYKKDLRIKALKAAKEKAVYLAEVVNDTVGDAIDITESNGDDQPAPMYANTISMYKSEEAAGTTPADIGFKTIKLTSQVRVVFQLN